MLPLYIQVCSRIGCAHEGGSVAFVYTEWGIRPVRFWILIDESAAGSRLYTY